MSQTHYTTMPTGIAKTSPHASYWDGGLGLIHMSDSCTVVEQERRPEPTGLLNAAGYELYRMPERVKIGFHYR